MKLSPRTSPLASRAGFTLIELLVVIAVIAILMGILFPVVSAIMEHSRRVQAKNDESQIVLAVKSYFTEYGRYPVDTSRKGTGDVVYSQDNNALIDVLRNRNGASIGNSLNARGVVYLEPAAASNQSQPRAGVQTSTGIWFDPWGSPYYIALDGDADNILNSPASPLPNFYSDAGQLQTGVIAWALGRNGEVGGGGAIKPGFSSESGKLAGSSDIVSW